MISRKVKVFDAYISDDDYYENQLENTIWCTVFDFHMSEVDENNFVYNKDGFKLKVRPEDIIETTKYELSASERAMIEKHKKACVEARKSYDRAKADFEDYEYELIHKIDENAFLGDRWDCDLSPFGFCIYKDNMGEPECIFCGQPEERK